MDDLTCTGCGEYAGSPIANRIDELEAKLAKAVEELENMQKVPRSDASYGILMVMIKYTLAELKGQNDE